MEKLSTYNEAETIAFGEKFAGRLRSGDLVACFGDLGSGKTRFIKGICRGLGVREHVASPTFTIVNEYTGDAMEIAHFDFYRIGTVNEIVDLGFDDYINSGKICLIEWAEKALSLLGGERYEIRFTLGNAEQERIITVERTPETGS